MSEAVLWILCILNIISVLLIILLFMRNRQDNTAGIEQKIAFLEKDLDKMERNLRDEISLSRTEIASGTRQNREELSKSLNAFATSLFSRMADISNLQKNQLDTFAQQLQVLIQTNQQRMSELSKLQNQQFDSFSAQMHTLSRMTETRLDKLRETVEKQLKEIQQDNSQKLEKMRLTVDEKLHESLEKRLGESFKLVSERLELVQRGLGEMQTLAAGVGDLKKVLTNVKTRGIWGEMQLGNLLEQILSPEQYAVNVATKVGSNERVEFAIKLPGKDDDNGSVWLPIDAKFPQEDYQRLVQAQEAGDIVLTEEVVKNLENRIKSEAKDIRDKYLDPPNTTDFAIMFLPIEGLFAEVLRRPGFCETLQREYRVNVTGPTTLAALLNSLQMGFRTLAIQKRSSEVWSVLGAVKTEFSKFGDVLAKTKEKLDQASKQIEQAGIRSRAIERKLRGVQELPVAETEKILGKMEDVD